MAVPGKPERRVIHIPFKGRLFFPPRSVKKDEIVVEKFVMEWTSPLAVEPMYHWFRDHMKAARFLEVVKTADWFRYSTRSAEWGTSEGKRSHQIERATQLLAGIQGIVKGVVAMRDDLQRIKECLGYYGKHEVDELTLKGVWVDFVDIKLGAASMAQMEKNLQFFSLRDWFFKIDARRSSEIDRNVDEMKTSIRVKVVLKRKLKAYLEWRKNWKEKLENFKKVIEERVESQNETVKLYKEWVKPLIVNISDLTQQRKKTNPLMFNISQSVLSSVSIAGYKQFGDIPNSDKLKEKILKMKEGLVKAQTGEEKKIESLEEIKEEDIDEIVKVAVREEWFMTFVYWIPVLEVTFNMLAAAPGQWAGTEAVITGKVYRIDAFIRAFLEWSRDPAEAYLQQVLEPIAQSKKDDKKREADWKSYPGLTEGFFSVFKSFKGVFGFFAGFFRGFQLKGGFVSDKYKLNAEQTVYEDAFAVYKKFKKSRRMLTWGDYSVDDEEKAWKWATEPVR